MVLAEKLFVPACQGTRVNNRIWRVYAYQADALHSQLVADRHIPNRGQLDCDLANFQLQKENAGCASTACDSPSSKVAGFLARCCG